MTAVMVELTPTRTAEESDAIELIDDVDAYTAGAGVLPGCGEDNPYQ